MQSENANGKIVRRIENLCKLALPLLFSCGIVLSYQAQQHSAGVDSTSRTLTTRAQYSFAQFRPPRYLAAEDSAQAAPYPHEHLAMEYVGVKVTAPVQQAAQQLNTGEDAEPPVTIGQSGQDSVAELLNQDPQSLFGQLRFAQLAATGTSLQTEREPGDALPLLSPMALMRWSKAPAAGRVHTVVLDPGHGGSDPGTIGPYGLLEKELTLEIANRVKELLLPHPDIRVILTRNQDRGFSRSNRVGRIKAAEGDLLVSLHLNNLPQRDLTVVESYYADRENILESQRERALQESPAMVKTGSEQQRELSYTEKSRRIAGILQRNIYRQVAAGNPEAIDAGVKKDTLYTLTRSAMPGTLIELTCLSNKREAQRLKSPQYRQKIAQAIAEGLLEYFSPEAPIQTGNQVQARIRSDATTEAI